MNNQGQVQSIIIFFIVVIATFAVALVVLYTVNTILTPVATSLNQTSQQAGNVVTAVNTSFTSVWDWVVLVIFFINLLLLFVSAFMVDIHPAFLFLYIIAAFFLVVFGSTALTALETLYSTAGTNPYSSTVASLPMTAFMVNNFGIVMLGVIVLSGIVMYAKIRINGGAGY